MLILEKRVYRGIHVPSSFISQFCNYHFPAKFIIFVALSNAYIFHGKEISLSSKEDLGHSKYVSPLKNIG